MIKTLSRVRVRDREIVLDTWVHEVLVNMAATDILSLSTYSSDGSLLAVVVSGNNDVAIWNDSGKLVCRLSDRAWSNISCIEWSPFVRVPLSRTLC